MKNKTIIYSPSYNIWGGGQIYIEQLCNYMNLHRSEAYILTAEPEVFSCSTIEMVNVLSKKKRFFSSFTIASNYKKEGFKTIILNDLASLWLAPIFKLYGYHVISLLHLYLQRQNENSLGHSDIEYQFLKFGSKFCDEIFSVNKNNQEVFEKKKVHFIGNYVPNWFFIKTEDNDSKKFDFILIARFSIEKNINLFIHLLNRMNKYFDRKYTALLVGDGPLKEEIEELIVDLNLKQHIMIHSWVDRKELPSVYDLGKCFVISSYHEGFATTLLEAHARGLPAIVTRSSGFCGEFVEGYNGTTGLVFEPEDLANEDFYKDVASLIDNYEQYKEKCLEKAKIFSEKNVLDPILQACIEK